MRSKPTEASREILVHWLDRFDILAHEHHQAVGKSAADIHDAIGKAISALWSTPLDCKRTAVPHRRTGCGGAMRFGEAAAANRYCD